MVWVGVAARVKPAGACGMREGKAARAGLARGGLRIGWVVAKARPVWGLLFRADVDCASVGVAGYVWLDWK